MKHRSRRGRHWSPAWTRRRGLSRRARLSQRPSFPIATDEVVDAKELEKKIAALAAEVARRIRALQERSCESP